MPRTTCDIPPAKMAIIAEAREILREYMASWPVITSWNIAEDYLRTAFAGEKVEVFRVLLLDRKNRLLEDWEAARGTVDHVPVYPREIMRRAIEVNASAVIIAHNHPSGDPTPSEADISMTKKIRDAADAIGITIHDHIIVGCDRLHSMRGASQF